MGPGFLEFQEERGRMGRIARRLEAKRCSLTVAAYVLVGERKRLAAPHTTMFETQDFCCQAAVVLRAIFVKLVFVPFVVARCR
jgi:hypothetical protein